MPSNSSHSFFSYKIDYIVNIRSPELIFGENTDGLGVLTLLLLIIVNYAYGFCLQVDGIESIVIQRAEELHCMWMMGTTTTTGGEL